MQVCCHLICMQNEIRVITDNPFEFEEDDESRFRSMMPHEAATKQRLVLCVKPHGQQVCDGPVLVCALSLFSLGHSAAKAHTAESPAMQAEPFRVLQRCTCCRVFVLLLRAQRNAYCVLTLMFSLAVRTWIVLSACLWTRSCQRWMMKWHPMVWTHGSW